MLRRCSDLDKASLGDAQDEWFSRDLCGLQGISITFFHAFIVCLLVVWTVCGN